MSARRLQVGLGIAGVLLAGLIAVIAIALAQGIGGPAEGRTTFDIEDAPVFVLEQFNGEPFALADYAGQPVFLYFWASWCIPCEDEAPLIESLWPEYRDRGWVFLGVNIWDAESDARRFLERFDLTFPTAPDVERNVYVDYGVQGLPVAYFIEPGLQIYARYDGLLTEETLRNLLDEATTATGGENAS
jgi:cytochrome c biogenesis protein CcmG/thiol:disulfide interchange protein DsbE